MVLLIEWMLSWLWKSATFVRDSENHWHPLPFLFWNWPTNVFSLIPLVWNQPPPLWHTHALTHSPTIHHPSRVCIGKSCLRSLRDAWVNKERGISRIYCRARLVGWCQVTSAIWISDLVEMEGGELGVPTTFVYTKDHKLEERWKEAEPKGVGGSLKVVMLLRRG